MSTPLKFVGATALLFIFSLTYAVLQGLFGLRLGPFAGSIGLLAVFVLVLFGLFMPSIRNTYGERIGQTAISLSAILLVLGSFQNEWPYWVLLFLWIGSLVFDVYKLDTTTRNLRLTPEQALSLDSLTLVDPTRR